MQGGNVEEKFTISEIKNYIVAQENLCGVYFNLSAENIKAAKRLLKQHFQLLKASRFVKTKPIGILTQPDFINGAVLVQTGQSRAQVNGTLKQIETQMGRKRLPNRINGKEKRKDYGPRSIDLDLLVWNRKIVHRDFYHRDFVKKAAMSLWPDIEQTTLKRTFS